MELEDFEYLIDLTITTKEWLFLNEFSKDTSDCPNVDSQTILSLSQ